MRNNEWYPADYTPGFTVEKWKELLADPSIFPPNCLQIMKRMLHIGGQATCMELSEKYGENWNFYNSGSSGICQRIHKKTNCPIMPRDEGGTRWWAILYLGREQERGGVGSFIWRLRDELRTALEQTDLTHVPLYAVQPSDDISGASPSVSSSKKRFWWLNANPRIWSFSKTPINCEQNYTLYNNDNKRRVFQNFLEVQQGDIIIGYESTPVKQIVALAQVTRESNGEDIRFKKIEHLAHPIPYADLKDQPLFSTVEGYPNFQGSLFKLTQEQFEFLMDIIRAANSAPPPSYTKEDFLSEVYLSGEAFDRLSSLLMRRKNIILQGAPGVGKTFAAKRLAYALMGAKDDSRLEIIQFHQSYSYEDFVMGYRPVGNEFSLEYGTFYKFCERARALPADKPCFFIIDEINRGNLSKIFGELLMLIESTHRGDSIRLAYGDIPFSVPENMYIIGMMNTADRSLALIDYALRRRFAFFEMHPAFDSDGFRTRRRQMNSARFDAVIDVIVRMNREIASDRTLGKGFRIGHSYFCDQNEYSDEWLRSVVEYDLIPTLEEYWFDDEDSLNRWSEELRGALK